ncbi:MAG: DUF3520 domain-containing protein, partial [bacterium]|nr:DUF3520 domain-containing protein [bacterium]
GGAALVNALTAGAKGWISLTLMSAAWIGSILTFRRKHMGLFYLLFSTSTLSLFLICFTKFPDLPWLMMSIVLTAITIGVLVIDMIKRDHRALLLLTALYVFFLVTLVCVTDLFAANYCPHDIGFNVPISFPVLISILAIPGLLAAVMYRNYGSRKHTTLRLISVTLLCGLLPTLLLYTYCTELRTNWVKRYTRNSWDIFHSTYHPGMTLLIRYEEFLPTRGMGRETRPSYWEQETKDAGNTSRTGVYENPFRDTRRKSRSILPADVDSASYANTGRYVSEGRVPPKREVRIEEMVNYFNYHYRQPVSPHTFAVVAETEVCPWNTDHRLVHIGIQGKRLNANESKPCNLVFLLDTSDSMEIEHGLPMIKASLKTFLAVLGKEDRIAIVSYGGNTGVVLPSTPASCKGRIAEALEHMKTGGSTANIDGIALAYQVAEKNFIANGNNRVVVCANYIVAAGLASPDQLLDLVEKNFRKGVDTTLCRFSMDNCKGEVMERIKNEGYGDLIYIENFHDAEKVFVKEMRADLFAIAEDVGIQVEFNSLKVKDHRLLGYENLVSASDGECFSDDGRDSGQLGSGHSLTALFEIIPIDSSETVGKTAKRENQQGKINTGAGAVNDIMTLRLRYKLLGEDKIRLLETAIKENHKKLKETSDNFRFSAAVTGFALLLRDSQYKGDITYKTVTDLASGAVGEDADGLRREFLQLVEACERYSK